MGEAIALLGLLVSAGSVIHAADQAKDAKDDAADLAALEAQAAADKQARATEKLTSKQRAAYAAAGVDLEGTPLEVITTTEREAAEERDLILKLGDLRSSAFSTEGQSLWEQGLGEGAGTLLTGLGNFLDD